MTDIAVTKNLQDKSKPGEFATLVGKKYVVVRSWNRRPTITIQRKSTSKNRPISNKNPNINISFDPDGMMLTRSFDRNANAQYNKFVYPYYWIVLDEQGNKFEVSFEYKFESNNDIWDEFVSIYRNFIKEGMKTSEAFSKTSVEISKKYNKLACEFNIDATRGSPATNIREALFEFKGRSIANLSKEKIDEIVKFFKYPHMDVILQRLDDEDKISATMAKSAEKNPRDFAD